MRCHTYHTFFRNLSNKTKISIIEELKKSEASVSELVETLKIEQSKLSHALASLKQCNIVECRVSGKKRIYSLNKTTILPMLRIIDKHNCEHCKHKK